MEHRPARSIIEVVVIVALLSVGLALVLIRLSGNRVAARRFTCENNLRNIYLSVAAYTLQNEQYPIGTQNDSSPIRSEPIGYHHNFLSGLLPFIDQKSLFEQIDFSHSVYDPENRRVTETRIPAFHCPSAYETLIKNGTAYAGISSSTELPISETGDGMFLLNQTITDQDVEDGLGYVFLVGEKSLDLDPALSWNSGTRASLRTTGGAINAPPPARHDVFFVGGLSSNHPGGANLLFTDGEVRFFSDDTDLRLLRQLASRNDESVEQ